MKNLEAYSVLKDKFLKPLYVGIYFFLVFSLGLLFDLSLLKLSVLILFPVLILLISLDIFWYSLLLYILISWKYFYLNSAKSLSLHALFVPFSLLAIIFYNKVNDRLSSNLKLYILLIVTSLSSTLFARSKVQAIHFWLMFSEFSLLYYWIDSEIKNINRLKIFFGVIVTLQVILIPLGIKEILIGVERIAPLGFSSNEYGAYLGFVFYIFMFLVFYLRKNRIRYFFLICSFIFVFFIIMTQSRGSQIALVFSYIIFFLLQVKKKKKTSIVIVLFVFLLIIGIAFSNKAKLDRFKSIDVDNFGYSEFERVGIWYSAVKVFQNNSILGAGPNNFENSYFKYFPFKSFLKPKLRRHAHNLYLNVLAEFGIIGFLLLIFFIFYFFKRIYKLIKSKKEVLNLIGYHLLGFFMFFLVYNMFGTAWTIVGRQVQTTNLVIFIFLANQIERLMNVKTDN